jgi:hypothetical protein
MGKILSELNNTAINPPMADKRWEIKNLTINYEEKNPAMNGEINDPAHEWQDE